MWTLTLMIYLANINDAELGFVRNFTSEQACDAAAVMAEKIAIRNGVRFSYVCLPAA